MTVLKRLQSLTTLDAEMLSGTAWMTMSYGIKLSLQLVSFVLLARTLGPESFGIYMAILSFAVLLEPFFDLGAYNLVVRDITKHGNSARAVGDSVALSLLVLPVGVLVLYLGYVFLFPTQLLISVVEVGLSQFIGGRAVSIALGVNIAHGTISRNAVLEIVNGAIRLLVVVLLIVSEGDLTTWIHLQLAGNCLMAVLVFVWLQLNFGLGVSGIAGIRERFTDGVHFAIGNAARNLNTELDKVMIYEFSSVAGTGIYAAAARFAVLSCVPVNALLSTVYRHFFIEGEKGYAFSRRYARSLIPMTAGYGAFASLALWVGADLIIFLLGDGYVESGEALRLLAFFPFIQSVTLPYADALTGAGLQNIRSRGMILTMIINLTLNLALIPVFGWHGAIFATLISQSTLMLFVVFYARRYL
ncbi:MAG: oligosaccharide flippase family protein [Gammaproteobacteria bacterium]|nr:oligosaccharide flippase family protein [Gammaproteobacteria bacterium]